MVSVSEVVAKTKPRTREVPINLDGDLLGRIDNLADEAKTVAAAEVVAGPDLASKAPGMLRELATLRAQADADVTVFSLTAVAGEIFDDLRQRYPPTEQQWVRYREEAQAAPFITNAPEIDYAEVLPRLTGLSVTAIDGEPTTWTEDDGLELWRKLTDGARADLGDAAWTLNNRGSLRPTFGTGTDETPPSGPESTTQQNGESPSRSS